MTQQRGPQNGKLLVGRRLLDRRPAGKLQFGTTALPHPRPPNGSLAAMPADLATDHAPAMTLSISVPLVALATKLFRIRRKHRLDGQSPSLQAQPVEAAEELADMPDRNHRCLVIDLDRQFGL